LQSVKERVSNQIVVQKNGFGKSVIRVIW
jgi:hypothetical protein